MLVGWLTFAYWAWRLSRKIEKIGHAAFERLEPSKPLLLFLLSLLSLPFLGDLRSGL